MNPRPTVSTSAKAHSWDKGNPGRCSFLMPQTSHIAFCMAPATPLAPSSRKTSADDERHARAWNGPKV